MFLPVPIYRVNGVSYMNVSYQDEGKVNRVGLYRTLFNLKQVWCVELRVETVDSKKVLNFVMYVRFKNKVGFGLTFILLLVISLGTLLLTWTIFCFLIKFFRYGISNR